MLPIKKDNKCKIGLDELPLPDIIRDDPDCFAAAGGQSSGSTLASWGAGEEKSSYNLAEHVSAWGTWLAKRCDEILHPKYHASEGATPLAYIWCRTYTCPDCRGTVPIFNNSVLQKTKKGVVAAVEPIIDKENKTIEWRVLCKNSGDELSKHKKTSFKTRAKMICPFCDYVSTTKEVQRCGKDEGLGHELIAVCEKTGNRRTYRSPEPEESKSIIDSKGNNDELEFGNYESTFVENLPPEGALGMRIRLYGFNQWKDIFNPRQYWAIHILMNQLKEAKKLMIEFNYPTSWVEALTIYLNCSTNLSVERNNMQTRWNRGGGKVESIYDTYNFPMRWEYSEIYHTSGGSGSLQNSISAVVRVVDSLISSLNFAPEPVIDRKSALEPRKEKFNLIITDPPYYDQIPYSDTLDFFHQMIKYVCGDMNDEFVEVFRDKLTPKWDSESIERELIDDSSRHNGNRKESKRSYEEGMAEVFRELHTSLEDGGRLVVVFAHKNPEAWETLVSALIRAGFQASAAWPIRTESAQKVSSGMRAFLSTSIWLVLKKRDPMADYAFDREVFASIKDNIEEKLRRFWDAGIRGPDFLWAALGPGLEVYSQYEVVRKFDSVSGDDELVSVGEFLDKVRDIVLRFSIGRLLTDYGSGEDEAEQIDDLTRYYLLHRSWFGHADVDAGEVTKFAVACGFTDTQLAGKSDILSTMRGKKRRLAVAAETAAADAQADADKRGGSKYVLNRWNERVPPTDEATFNNEDRPPSSIDHVHRLLHLRMEGDKQAMDEHIKHWALGGHPVMPALVQALQEICKEENGKSGEELSLLESLSKDLERLAGAKPVKGVTLKDYINEDDD